MCKQMYNRDHSVATELCTSLTKATFASGWVKVNRCQARSVRTSSSVSSHKLLAAPSSVECVCDRPFMTGVRFVRIHCQCGLSKKPHQSQQIIIRLVAEIWPDLFFTIARAQFEGLCSDFFKRVIFAIQL